MPTGKKGPTKELDDLCMLSLYSDLKYHVIHGGIVYTKKTMVVAPKMDKDGRFNRNASFKSLLGPLDAEQKKYGSTV